MKFSSENLPCGVLMQSCFLLPFAALIPSNSTLLLHIITSMVQKFSQNCEGAKFLRRQFQLFDQDNTKGINYHLCKSNDIKQIWTKFPILHQYSATAFKNTNFKNHANNYVLSKYSNNARREQGKCFYS